MPEEKTVKEAELRENEKDPWFNTTIGKLVLHDDQFAVWIAKDTYDVWWMYEGDPPSGLATVTARVAELESIDIAALEDRHRRAFKALVGEGLARGLEGDAAAAKRTLDLAAGYARARLGELARRWFLVTAMQGAVLALLVMLGTYTLSCGAALDCTTGTALPIYCIGMGILGAAFSIASRTGSFSLDPASGEALHRLEAVARIATGALAGFVVLMAIRAGLVLPNLAHDSRAALFVIAFVAGSSERMIPTLVSSLDQIGSSKANGSGTTPPGDARTDAAGDTPDAAGDESTRADAARAAAAPPGEADVAKREAAGEPQSAQTTAAPPGGPPSGAAPGGKPPAG